MSSILPRVFRSVSRYGEKNLSEKTKTASPTQKSIFHQVQKAQSRPDFVGTLFWSMHFKVQLAKLAGIKRHFLP